MPRSAPFAASFLSAFCALSSFAADLRPMQQPSQIAAVFPAAAKVRVLNVWAMWCVPCVAEMPDLKAIDDAFGSDVAIVGVTLDDMLPDAQSQQTRQFLDREKIAFPNIYYTGNADDLGERLRFSGEIPITIVYDRNGNELWRHKGKLDRGKTI